MLKFFPVILLFWFAMPAKAELVKGKTIGYTGMGTGATVEFADSARVYPYEPAYGEWRLVMWVGYIGTEHLQGDTLVKAGSPMLEQITSFEKTKTLRDFKMPVVEDLYKYAHPKQKKLVLYLYIPDTAIIENSRMEPRMEKVLAAKKNRQWPLFEEFKRDFGFTDAELTGPYNLHFVYDERSPDGANDFRMVVFSDSARHIIAVAYDGYRKMKLETKNQAPLDRKLVIYYVVQLPEDVRKKIEHQFLESYKFRN